MFKNIRFPIINRFTCTEGQLNSIIANIKNKNMLPILDYANENNLDCKNNYQQLINLINNYPNNLISIKLSSFNIKNNISEAESKVFNLVKLAKKNNSKILIDAENYLLQDNINFISDKLMKIFNKDKVIIYKTYQMYRKDSYQNLLQDIEYFKNQNIHLGTKLVRGAYHNSEKYLGQLYSDKLDTDLNYNQAILLTYDQKIPTILATHNNESINLGTLLNKYALSQEKNYQFSFAHLLDMNNQKYDSIKYDQTVYTYIPYGPYKEMIPYLSRRLYENLDTIKYMVK